jgi:hypothetical protein
VWTVAQKKTDHYFVQFHLMLAADLRVADNPWSYMSRGQCQLTATREYLK